MQYAYKQEERKRIMTKSFVVLTASFRPKGNSAQLADLLISDLAKKGCAVKRFDTAFLRLTGCHHCDRCYQTGKACVFDDDFNPIADAIDKADAIVFVTPLYWYSWPSSIKNVIDRFYALYCGKHLFKGKKAALIAVCGDEAKEDPFQGLVYSFDKSIKLMEGELAGHLLYYGMDEEGALKNALENHSIEKIEAKILS
jgi:multimeric flavodoxin WrbA